MTTNYLITRPEHDDTTHYLSFWSRETIDMAQKRGIKVCDLHREKATKLEIEGRMAKFSPKLVVFNGHGDEKTVTGHKNEPLITAGENEDLLQSKIVYAISCKSGKTLGPKSIEKGALSYTGYDDDFIFMYEPERISTPLDDETAGLFLEPSIRFIESILKGNNVETSQDRLQNMIKENILKSVSSNSQDSHLVRFLWWDMKHLISHGDGKACL